MDQQAAVNQIAQGFARTIAGKYVHIPQGPESELGKTVSSGIAQLVGAAISEALLAASNLEAWTKAQEKTPHAAIAEAPVPQIGATATVEAAEQPETAPGAIPLPSSPTPSPGSPGSHPTPPPASQGEEPSPEEADLDEILEDLPGFDETDPVFVQAVQESKQLVQTGMEKAHIQIEALAKQKGIPFEYLMGAVQGVLAEEADEAIDQAEATKEEGKP